MLMTPAVSPDDPLKSARDAVFLKLGRNIVLFQQLESGLKRLFAALVVEGHSPDDVARRRAEREAVLATSSLGVVAKRLFDELCAPVDTRSEPTLPDDVRVYVHSRVCFEIAHIEPRRVALAALIEERNRLVHHLDRHYDLRSAEGIDCLDADLEPQAERIRLELRELGGLFDVVNRGREMLRSEFLSPEFEARIQQQILVHSPIVQGLIHWGCELARGDGWCVLQRALARLGAEDPDAVRSIRERHGHGSLRSLLLACGLFELRDEPTERGSRLLYRPREDLGLPP